MLEPFTDATGCSSWPTPRTTDEADGRGAIAIGNGLYRPSKALDAGRLVGQANLADAVKMWPTPTTRDHKDTGGCANVPENCLLGRMVLMLLAMLWMAYEAGTTSIPELKQYAFDPAVQDMVEQRIKDLCHATALGFGATATVRYERIYPATINTEAEARFAGDVAAALVGEDGVDRDLEPSMGAEDFSFMLQSRPGAYLRLGQGMGAGNSTLHNSRYDFNDDILPLGAALHAGLVERAMPLAGGQ